MARRVLAEFGRMDILVNNAAVAAPGSFLEVPVRRWDLVLNVNLRGAYLCARAFLPSIIERRSGSIINVSSYAAHTEGSWGLAYSVSKAAMERLTTGLAAELSPAGIAVNALQIERYVSSEGFVYLSPGADFSTWDKPETVGEAWSGWRAASRPSPAGSSAWPPSRRRGPPPSLPTPTPSAAQPDDEHYRRGVGSRQDPQTLPAAAP